MKTVEKNALTLAKMPSLKVICWKLMNVFKFVPLTIQMCVKFRNFLEQIPISSLALDVSPLNLVNQFSNF